MLTDTEVHALVEHFQDTALDDLPDAYNGLTAADLHNILLCFRGHEWRKFPPLFGISYLEDGQPKTGFIYPD